MSFSRDPHNGHGRIPDYSQQSAAGKWSPIQTEVSAFHIRRKDQTWTDEFEVPVMYDVPEFTNLGIDDGDSEIFGSGNGNNIAEPGESVHGI